MTKDDLRQMVRDVLREVVAQRGQVGGTGTVEQVRISNDADLMAFAQRVVEAQAAVASGKLRFTLVGATKAASAPAAPATASVPAGMLTGVITETMVNHHAGAGRLLLAPGAVVTPLARDRARQLNLKLERSR